MEFEQLALFAFIFFGLGMAAAYVILRLTAKEEPEPFKLKPEANGAEQEVLRVWLDSAHSTVYIQTHNGQRMALKLSEALPATLETGPSPVEPRPVDAVTLPAPDNAAAVLAASPTPPAAPSPSLAPAAALLPPMLAAAESQEKPKLNLVGSFIRSVQTANLKTPAAKPLSIALQIDEILQQQIGDGPMAERGLKLVDLPNHSLGVMLDQQVYEGIEAVPEDEIRSLIRSAAVEWEKQQKKLH